MKKYLVFDVESIGLHGEGYAVGGVLYDHQGWELSEFRFACLPEDAKGDGNGRDWVKANAPAIPVTHASPREMRSAFWEVWMKAKKDGAMLVADCGWPVEARFLAACVDDDHTERAWQGPYPMHEAASFLEAAGMDCLGTYEREENELPVHDPLADARQTGRLLFDALAAPPLRPAGDEGDGEEPKVVIPTTFKGNTTTVTADYGLILPTYAAGSLSFLEGYDTRVVKLSDAEAAIFKAALHTEKKEGL